MCTSIIRIFKIRNTLITNLCIISAYTYEKFFIFIFTHPKCVIKKKKKAYENKMLFYKYIFNIKKFCAIIYKTVIILNRDIERSKNYFFFF